VERGHGQLRNYFDEGLSNADALASQEWREAERAVLLAVRAQKVLAFRIEVFRDEFLWLLPLFWVVLHAAHADRDWVTLVNLKIASLQVPAHSHDGRVVDGRLHAQ